MLFWQFPKRLFKEGENSSDAFLSSLNVAGENVKLFCKFCAIVCKSMRNFAQKGRWLFVKKGEREKNMTKVLILHDSGFIFNANDCTK
ncbi:hypothetical protein CLOM621_08716 [Clostridium sp. M62/1]|nr:hypothetical protein CLOM621_08716 [Clostridium sp. M62/1]